MVKLCKEIRPDTTLMRDVYGGALVEAGKNNPDMVVVSCDTSSAVGLNAFFDTFPERSYNVGIAEANGAGVAGGLAAVGLKPFLHSMAPFITRRAYDQLFMACDYVNRDVVVVGSHAGVSTTHNGGTHMCFEDVGIMRNLAHATVIEPTDSTMMRNLVQQLPKLKGLVYFRFAQLKAPIIYEEGSEFTVGKAVKLREGKDATIIAMGVTVAEAIKAADILAAEGIEATVVDMFTVKPIDAQCVVECAKETGAIVTVENHNIHNGLGSAVAEVLSENYPTLMERLGVKDVYGEVGSLDYLMDRFGISARHIVESVKNVVAKKNQK